MKNTNCPQKHEGHLLFLPWPQVLRYYYVFLLNPTVLKWEYFYRIVLNIFLINWQRSLYQTYILNKTLIVLVASDPCIIIKIDFFHMATCSNILHIKAPLLFYLLKNSNFKKKL